MNPIRSIRLHLRRRRAARLAREISAIAARVSEIRKSGSPDLDLRVRTDLSRVYGELIAIAARVAGDRDALAHAATAAAAIARSAATPVRRTAKIEPITATAKPADPNIYTRSAQ